MGATIKNRVLFRKVILATMVAVSLFILMAGLALATWWVRIPSISQTPGLVSAYADVAASRIQGSQEYVAVVWSEGSTNHTGAIKLRWGPPGQSWRWPWTTVEDFASLSREPAIAVYSDTAYIAYIKQSGGNWIVGYAECKYGDPPTCTKTSVFSDMTQKGAVDIVLCGTTPYVVWAEVGTSTDAIWYSSRPAASWQAPDEVSSGSTDNSSPSIACDGANEIIFAWIEDDQKVEYMYSGGTPLTIWTAGTHETPFNTSMAAYGTYVDIVWDFRYYDPPNADEYHVYQWRRLLPDLGYCTNEIPDATTYYTSAIQGSGASEYVLYLRPSNAIYSDTAYAQPVPVVVWHADVGGVYEVMYSRGTSFASYCDVATWSSPVTLKPDFSTRDCSSPSIATGISDTVTHTHVVFQNRLDAPDPNPDPWDIHYLNDFDGPLTEEAEPSHNAVYLPLIMKKR